MPEYHGVDTQHPKIVEAIKRMAKDGKPIDEIARVVGMPHQVVESHAPKVKKP